MNGNVVGRVLFGIAFCAATVYLALFFASPWEYSHLAEGWAFRLDRPGSVCLRDCL